MVCGNTLVEKSFLVSTGHILSFPRDCVKECVASLSNSVRDSSIIFEKAF